MQQVLPQKDNLIEKNLSKIEQIKKDRYTPAKQSLSLVRCEFWRQILESQNWQKLKVLTLSYNNITDKDLLVITKRSWPNLKQLWINSNNISQHGVKQLTKCQWPALQQLSLYDNKIGKQGISQLFNHHFPKLTIASLGVNYVSNINTIYNLGKVVSSIKQLNLSNNKFNSNGMKFISKLKLPELVKINIGQCCIGDDGTKSLIKCNWPKLQQIQAGYNQIGLTGFMVFVHNNWKQLKKITLFYNVMSAVGLTVMMNLSANIPEQNICFWGLRNAELQKLAKSFVAMIKLNPQKKRRGYYDYD